MLDQVEIFHGLSDEELKALRAVVRPGRSPRIPWSFTKMTQPIRCLSLSPARSRSTAAIKTAGIHYEHPWPGDYFGELALLDDSTRSASVRTVEKSEFRIVMKEDFSGVLEDHPGITQQLISNLAGRVRKLTADVKSLALQDVYGRVANVLMDLAEERGDGTLFIPEKLTQQDIADRVGASREMVARILKDLTIGEYIRFEGRHIVINTRLPAKY